MEGENSGKEIKRTEINSSNSSEQIQMLQDPDSESRVDEMNTSMHNVPTEILMEILKCVDTRTLFACRVVNLQWSAIASRILMERPTFPNSFDFSGQTWVTDGDPWSFRGKRTSLKDFVQCMKTSKNFPFSHFQFFTLKPEGQLEFFDHQDFLEFLSNTAESSNQNPNENPTPKIKGFKLEVSGLRDISSFHILAEKLRDLLLYKIPRLEEISLKFDQSAHGPQVKLFPEPKPTARAESDKEGELKFQLPHLKILRYGNCYPDMGQMISHYPQMTKDLLHAAVNLKELHVQIERYRELQFLDSLGKIHLLKGLAMRMNQDFLSPSQMPPQWPRHRARLAAFLALVFPKLEILDIDYVFTDNYFLDRAIDFLDSLFESSKNTLKTLKLKHVRIFSHVQLPVFKNLKKLTILIFFGMKAQVFPAGIRSLNIFPALQFLELAINRWSEAFPSPDSIPLLPSVKTVVLRDIGIDAEAISILAQMCPNVKNFEIRRDHEMFPNGPFDLLFPQVGRAIWTHMTQLESLEFPINVGLRTNKDPHALDSCFTGISIENCQRLDEAKVIAEKEKLTRRKSPSKIPESESVSDSELTTTTVQVEREHPSILDMKNLKTLKINPDEYRQLVKRRDFFANRLTWISEQYAFKLVPYLKFTHEEEDRRI